MDGMTKAEGLICLRSGDINGGGFVITEKYTLNISDGVFEDEREEEDGDYEGFNDAWKLAIPLEFV
jgi:hypothetical protein